MAAVVRLEINADDMARFRRVLQDPEFVGKPRREMLSRMRTAGLREARRPLSAAGTGLAYRSMSARYDIPAGRVTIYSKMPLRRAQSIESGELPGSAPPLRRLFRWKAATGDPRDVLAIQRQLRERGVLGKRMIGGALEYVRARVPEYFRAMAEKMERRWARQ